jgi:double-stranded uracil-DNA glycosylase
VTARAGAGRRVPLDAARLGRVRLPDVVVDRPRVLLVGINPSLRSAAVGHHFASPGNPFWRLLYASGLVPEPLTYEEDHRLSEFGIALVNLCPRPTRSAAELAPAEFDTGRRELLRKCRRMRPQVVAFVGVSLYQSYFQLKTSGGPGEKGEDIDGARVFVVPNPSGLNASFPGFSHKLVWYEKLRQFVDREATGAPAAGAARRPKGRRSIAERRRSRRRGPARRRWHRSSTARRRWHRSS